MAAKILLTVLLLFVALEFGFAQCQCGSNNYCSAKPIASDSCVNASYQCICDFTCSGWDKPCNWAFTCPEEIAAINDVRRKKNKLIVFRLPNRSHKECLEINIKTHNRENCCDKFCCRNALDTCF